MYFRGLNADTDLEALEKAIHPKLPDTPGDRNAAEGAATGVVLPATPPPAASGGSAVWVPLLVIGALGLFFLSGRKTS